MSSDALLAELMGMAGLADTETSQSQEVPATPVEAVAAEYGIDESADEPESEDSGDFIEAHLA
jgi:hypothetical protein